MLHFPSCKARIFQHEYDHLMGTLYIDRMDSRSLAARDSLARIQQGQMPPAEGLPLLGRCTCRGPIRLPKD